MTRKPMISCENPCFPVNIFPTKPIHSSPSAFQALQCDYCGPLGSVETAAHLVPEAEFAQLRLDVGMFLGAKKTDLVYPHEIRNVFWDEILMGK